MKSPTLILGALFSLSLTAALPLPAGTYSLNLLVGRGLTNPPQYIRRQGVDIPEDNGDSSEVDGSDDDHDSAVDDFDKVRRQSGRNNGDSSGDDDWKRDGREKVRR